MLSEIQDADDDAAGVGQHADDDDTAPLSWCAELG
jgi:hypothetical protein